MESRVLVRFVLGHYLSGKNLDARDAKTFSESLRRAQPVRYVGGS